MKLLGVTGRIGSGKSKLCEILSRRHQCNLIDADRLGHAALEVADPIRRDLLARFGPQVLDAGGSIDRGRLAEIVFADEVALRDLGSIVHPWMIGQILQRLTDLREGGQVGIVVLDAAVLLEWTDDLVCDWTVLVRCPDETSIRRLVLRGMAEEEARRRMARQDSEEQMRRQVDFVVDNAGSLDDLEHGACRLWDALHRKEEGRAR